MMVRKEKVRRIALYVLGVVVYYAWFQAFYNMVRFEDFFYYETFNDVMVGVGYNFLPILALFLFNTAIVFWITPRVRPEWLKAILDIVLSIGATTIVNLCFLGIQAWLFHRQGNVDWAGTLMSDFSILLINEVIFFIMHYRESKLREEQQRHLATRMQYDMLKTQVNPHFLFNSLNILYSLSSIDTEKSREFILNLTQMYRYILTQQQKQKVKVRDELEFLNAYIHVLSMRYPDSFFVNITDREKMEDKEIIPYSLQLLIENITKHNAIRASQPMHVEINIGPSQITISNPIYPKLNSNPNESTGTGLKYLTDLYAYYGKDFKTSTDNNIFAATIPYL